MKQISTFFALVLMTSTVFAASDECSRQLDSMLYRTSEASRLDTAARLADDGAEDAYRKLSNEHFDAVNRMKVDFNANCLK